MTTISFKLNNSSVSIFAQVIISYEVQVIEVIPTASYIME